MQKKRFILVLMLTLNFLFLISLTACGGRTIESQIQAVEVVRGDLMVGVSGSGTINAADEVELTFGISGKIDEVNVEEGNQVTKGQVLASLDTMTLERTVKAAEQVVTTAEIAVMTTEIAVTTTEIAVTTTEIAVRAAEMDLELANNSYQQLTTPYPFLTYEFVIPASLDAIRVAQQRIKEVQEEFQKGLKGEQYSMGKIQEQLLAAEESLIEAEVGLDWGLGAGIRPSGIDYWTLRTAQIQIEKAQLALDSAQNDLDIARSELDIARNDLDITRNELDIARNELDKVNDERDKTIIMAPFDGVVAKVNIKSGDVLSSANYATNIAIEVVDQSRMELKVDVDEIDIPNVKLGQKTIISVDALPALRLEGEVTSISLMAKEEASLMLYEVKISFDIPADSKLRAGMSVSVDVIFNERSNILLVPNRAIGQDSQGNPIVMVQVEEQAQSRSVVIGISDELETEIVSGLTEGEAVLIERRVSSGSGPSFFGG